MWVLFISENTKAPTKILLMDEREWISSQIHDDAVVLRQQQQQQQQQQKERDTLHCDAP